jgi:hypothetical protein
LSTDISDSQRDELQKISPTHLFNTGWEVQRSRLPDKEALKLSLTMYDASIGVNSLFHPLGKGGPSKPDNIKIWKSVVYNLLTLNPELRTGFV